MTSDYRMLFIGIISGFTVAIAVAIAGLAGLLPGTSTNAKTAPTAGSENVAAPATAPQTVAVSLTEWKIAAAAGAAIGPLKPGEVKFDVHNDGTTLHEFVVIKTDAEPGSFQIEAGKFNEETAGESPGEAADIEPGQAKDATMSLEPGKYVYVCNLPGHYLSGMRGQLIVQ